MTDPNLRAWLLAGAAFTALVMAVTAWALWLENHAQVEAMRHGYEQTLEGGVKVWRKAKGE